MTTIQRLLLAVMVSCLFGMLYIIESIQSAWLATGFLHATGRYIPKEAGQIRGLSENTQIRHSSNKMADEFEKSRSLPTGMSSSSSDLSVSSHCPNFGTMQSLLDAIRDDSGTRPLNLTRLLQRPGASLDKVPNIVHYIWFTEHNFTFLNYVSFLSVERMLRPSAVFLHGDVIPSGTWWRRTLRDVRNLYFVRLHRPVSINGQEVRLQEHAADVERLKILIKYGGIYLDTDYIVLRTFRRLMERYPLTLAREQPDKISNGVILARRCSPFLRVWLETYHTFLASEWEEHSSIMAHRLATLLPHLVHVHGNTLLGPTWTELDKLFDIRYDWTTNYGIHVWQRFREPPNGPNDIQQTENTLAEVMRFILYGSSKRRRHGQI